MAAKQLRGQPRPVKHSFQVYIDLRVDGGHAQLGPKLGPHHAGVIDQHVEHAEAAQGFGEGRVPGGDAGYVVGQGQAAGGLETGRSREQGGQVVVGGHHLPAAPVKRPGQVPPDALRRAGDENSLGHWVFGA